MKIISMCILMAFAVCCGNNQENRGFTHFYEFKHLDLFINDDDTIDFNRFNIIFNTLCIYPAFIGLDTNLILINQLENRAFLITKDTVYTYKPPRLETIYENKIWETFSWNRQILSALQNNDMDRQFSVDSICKRHYYCYDEHTIRRKFQGLWIKSDLSELYFIIIEQEAIDLISQRLLIDKKIKNDILDLKDKKVININNKWWKRM
ncbi:MAG: hypothetical protein QM786_06770 [Breznakibacter sp.]